MSIPTQSLGRVVEWVINLVLNYNFLHLFQVLSGELAFVPALPGYVLVYLGLLGHPLVEVGVAELFLGDLLRLLASIDH